MFTEPPPLELGKSRLISFSGQTASFFPTLLFDPRGDTLQNWSTCSLCSTGLGQRGTPEEKQEREDKGGLGIRPSLWGGLFTAVSFQRQQLLSGQPSPQVSFLLGSGNSFLPCPALQTKLGHSSAPSTGYYAPPTPGGQQTMTHEPDTAQSLFWLIKFYWKPYPFIYVTSMAAFCTRNRGHLAPKAENIFDLALYREICQLLSDVLLIPLKIIL